MWPFPRFRIRLAGRGGRTEYDVIVPPPLLGIRAAMGVETVYVTGDVYWRFVGAAASTVMFTIAVVMPEAFMAVTT